MNEFVLLHYLKRSHNIHHICLMSFCCILLKYFISVFVFLFAFIFTFAWVFLFFFVLHYSSEEQIRFAEQNTPEFAPGFNGTTNCITNAG